MKGEMRIGKNHTAGRNPAKLQESKADLTPSPLHRGPGVIFHLI